MRIAIVGCGYVADQYMLTLPSHADLELVGVHDRDAERARRFGAHYGVAIYHTLERLLGDSGAEMILNLTNPRSHFAVSRACLEAGKHVYSEKPLAMTIDQSRELVRLASSFGVRLSGAPSRVLGEPAQTMWKALRDDAIGRARLVYAEMDDGMIHRMDYANWLGASGAPWPYRDEFEMGCVVEHAGYTLTWLVAFFGPAVEVTAVAATISDLQVPGVDSPGPDFALAHVRHSSGVVSRVTFSNIAPLDHSIRIFGDRGILATENVWMPQSPVSVEERIVDGEWVHTPKRTMLPLLRDPRLSQRIRALRKVDFCLGPLELADAIREGRECRLSAQFCAHVTELVLAIHESTTGGRAVRIESSFEPMVPMPWSQ